MNISVAEVSFGGYWPNKFSLQLKPLQLLHWECCCSWALMEMILKKNFWVTHIILLQISTGTCWKLLTAAQLLEEDVLAHVCMRSLHRLKTSTLDWQLHFKHDGLKFLIKRHEEKNLVPRMDIIIFRPSHVLCSWDLHTWFPHPSPCWYPADWLPIRVLEGCGVSPVRRSRISW